MKAMVLHSTGNIDSRPLKYEDIPIPEISDGEVLIKVHACGVCRSQLHTIEGEWGAPMRLPLVVGHEIAGEVVKTGRRVSNLKIGDRVGLQPTYNTCNSRASFSVSPYSTGTAPNLSASSSFFLLLSTATVLAPWSLANWTAICPTPPTPNTAIVL